LSTPFAFRAPTPADVSFFELCFFNRHWAHQFGLPADHAARRRMMDNLVHGKLNEVVCYIVEAHAAPVALVYAIRDAAGTRAELFGGLSPAHVGSGMGIAVAAAILDVLFTRYNVEAVFCRVLPHNAASLRMLLALGFAQLGRTAKIYEDAETGEALDALQLRLARGAFPNALASRLMRV
jgi:RimJ/RimL family protein N-acetyltransferase